MAMSERDRQTIELGNLDLVPRGSRVPAERGTYVYGLLDLGLLRARGDACGTPRLNTMNELSRNRLGVAGRETLDGGYEAYARLETSLQHSDRPGCGLPFWDGAAHVGWGRPDLGWLEAGRVRQPAHAVATLADPWEGESTVAEVAGLLYGAPADPAEASRTSQGLVARTSDRAPWQLELHGSLRPGADPHGAALRGRLGAWQAAVGAQRWNAGNWSVPLVTTVLLGDWTAFGGLSGGRLQGEQRHAFTLGARWVQPTGPRRWTWRFAFAQVHDEQAAPLRQWSAGAEQRLNARTALHAEGALQQREGQAARLSVGVGLRHRFELR